MLAACAGTNWVAPDGFVYVPVKTRDYEIATWQKISNPQNNRIHIYIEGDGYAFNAYGHPTNNPTPRGTFMRDLAASDSFDNVVYVARPCQFIMSKSCNESDWTDGRFSQKIIDAESLVIKQIGENKKITLVGYSGGAMVSGLIIKQNPDIKFEKWITVAGVLNHEMWTEYFGDEPLAQSLDMEKLPDIPQIHFAGDRDEVVPIELTKKWAAGKNIKITPNATHNDFGNLKIFD